MDTSVTSPVTNSLVAHFKVSSVPWGCFPLVYSETMARSHIDLLTELEVIIFPSQSLRESVPSYARLEDAYAVPLLISITCSVQQALSLDPNEHWRKDVESGQAVLI